MIDIKNKAQIRALKFNDLIDDAAERADVEALAWLAEQNDITNTKTSKKGKTFTVGASFLLVRNEYLSKFLGWVPEKATAEPQPTFAEKQASRAAAIKDAMAKAAAATVAAHSKKK